MHLVMAYKNFFLGIVVVLILSPLAPCQNESVDYLFSPGVQELSAADPFELGSVNVANGNLHIEIPLASFPQRGSAPTLTYELVYDSRMWQPVDAGTYYAWQPTAIFGCQWIPWPTTWRLVTSADPGYVTPQIGARGDDYAQWYVYGPYTWTDPYGTPRIFPIYTYSYNTGSVASIAADGSGYYMQVTWQYSSWSATIYAKDGTQVYPAVVDTNGNAFGTDAAGNVVDTLGRIPVITTKNGNQLTFNILNSQGGRTPVTVILQSVPYATQFVSSVDQVANSSSSTYLTGISSVSFVDGTSYHFQYDPQFGEITQASLPTGGTVSIQYTNVVDAYGAQNRWVQQVSSAARAHMYAPVGGGHPVPLKAVNVPRSKPSMN